MRSGSDLVPVFSFGENDIFEQLANERGTKIYALQKKFQAVFGFTLRESSRSCIVHELTTFLSALFFGRGLFNCELPECEKIRASLISALRYSQTTLVLCHIVILSFQSVSSSQSLYASRANCFTSGPAGSSRASR